MLIVTARISEAERGALRIVADGLLKAEHGGRHDGLGGAIVSADFYLVTARKAARAIKRIIEDE